MQSNQQIIDSLPERLGVQKNSYPSQVLDQSKMLNLLNSIYIELGNIKQNLKGYDLNPIIEALDREPLAPYVEAPIVNVSMPEDSIKSVEKAINSLKLVSPDSVTIKNVNEFIDAINSLKPLLEALGRSFNQEKDIEEGSIEKVEITNLPKIPTFPKEILGYLKYLENLDTKADKPISVRLSDGKKYYTAIAEAVRQAVAFSSSQTSQKKGSNALNTFATVGITSVLALAANDNRLSSTFTNDSNATIYISKGQAAVVGSGIRLNSFGGALIIDDYSGDIYAISEHASKNLCVSEVY